MTRSPLSLPTLIDQARRAALLGALALAGCAGTPLPDASRSATVPQAIEAGAPPAEAREMPAPPAPTVEAAVPEDTNIFFAAGTTTVDTLGEAKLRRHADDLKQNRKKTVTLVGHTSTGGSRSFNLATTDQRLLAVSKLLRSYGVWARQIRPHSVIRESVPAGCRTPECSRLTRRVELRFAP